MNEKKQIRKLFEGHKRSIQFTNRGGKRYVKIEVLDDECFADVGNKLRSFIDVRMTSAETSSATFRLPAFPYEINLSKGWGETWQIAPDAQIFNVHSRAVCKHPCTLHAPTDHHLRDLPLIWRTDRGCFERICKHGTGHPDPDDKGHEGIHGCCGCCSKPIDVLTDATSVQPMAGPPGIIFPLDIISDEEIEIGVND